MTRNEERTVPAPVAGVPRHGLSLASAFFARALALVLALAMPMLGAGTPMAHAQEKAFTNEELDQMLAPVALYPDALLAQILMASTYPADVKEAADWSKAHPDAKGDAAVGLVQDREWEASVKSLVAFPQVLVMMGDKPADVQRLGDAFLEDPGRVMDRVQVLRTKAQQAGNLKTTEQQKVSTQTEANKQVIVIEPAKPDVIYVPVYQPTVVYGPWPYPSYPPYYWPPPRYYYPTGGFVAGVFWGAAIVGVSNGLWGGFGWGNNDININVNRYNNINVNNKISNNNNTFVHNADRRRDVPYRDAKSREQYGKKQLDGAKDREAYRGKDGSARDADRAKAADTLKQRGADPVAGREQLKRDGAAQAGTRDRAAATDRSSAADRTGDRTGDRAGDKGGGKGGDRAGDRSGGSLASDRQASNSGALAGVRDTGAANAAADRGKASRESMAGSRDSRPSTASTRPAPAARPQTPRPAPSAAPRAAPRAAAGGGGLRR